MSIIKSTTYLLLLFILCLSGCNDSIEGQNTPSELLGKFYNSLIDNNSQFLVECAPELQKNSKAAESILKLFQNGYKFQDKLTQRFGANAWEEFTTIPSERPNDRAEFMFKLPPKTSFENWANTIEIRIDGDFAFFNDPLNEDVEYKLYKKGGRWFMDMKYAAGNLDSFTKFNDRFSNCIIESLAYIDQAENIGDIRYYMAQKIGF